MSSSSVVAEPTPELEPSSEKRRNINRPKSRSVSPTISAETYKERETGNDSNWKVHGVDKEIEKPVSTFVPATTIASASSSSTAETFKNQPTEVLPTVPPVALPVRLFVGQVPETFLDSDVYNLFLSEGVSVLDISIIRDKHTGRHRHCTFVTVCNRAHADRAIDIFHNRRYLKGMSNPMQVREANAPKSNVQRTTTTSHTVLQNPWVQNMGSMNNAGNITATVAGMYLNPASNPYFYNPYNNYNMMYANPMQNNIPSWKKSYVEGPSGANLFVNNLPEEFGDDQLFQLFCVHGKILSYKVFVDRHTKRSKGFGFVSFSTSEEARSAIEFKNGVVVSGRKLVVELKKVKSLTTSPVQMTYLNYPAYGVPQGL